MALRSNDTRIMFHPANGDPPVELTGLVQVSYSVPVESLTARRMIERNTIPEASVEIWETSDRREVMTDRKTLETRRKTVRRQVGSASVDLPQAWVGETVTVVRGPVPQMLTPMVTGEGSGCAGASMAVSPQLVCETNEEPIFYGTLYWAAQHGMRWRSKQDNPWNLPLKPDDVRSDRVALVVQCTPTLKPPATCPTCGQVLLSTHPKDSHHCTQNVPWADALERVMVAEYAYHTSDRSTGFGSVRGPNGYRVGRIRGVEYPTLGNPRKIVRDQFGNRIRDVNDDGTVTVLPYVTEEVPF